jgi:hypothetical protein
LAVQLRLANESRARANGWFGLNTFLAPGGDRTSGVLHYERSGEREARRMHGAYGSTTDRWCAVAAAAGSPVLAIVCASYRGIVSSGEMGLEGVHPTVGIRFTLSPGDTLEEVAYVVVASNLPQARLYRHLCDIESLP